MRDLKDKIAFITGGASGLGRSAAEQLTRNDRREPDWAAMDTRQHIDELQVTSQHVDEMLFERESCVVRPDCDA